MARKTRKKTAKQPRAKTTLSAVNFDSEVVRQRLDRIQSNYLLLDEMLADLEARVPDTIESPADGGPRKPR